ncbi:MAG TPA: sodium:calcium antiporter [Candidatus Binatia bacterium]|nr:sodium:calcium antiporter [Candidatus Binatia bacterium]
MDFLILLGSFVVILTGAELFTNGIEWFGRKLGLAEGAVGSVLAAVGTALPETMIPIIAILFATGEHSEEIGVGAILGAPFMLATLAMFVTGVAVMIQARKRSAGDVMPVDSGVLATDMRSFAISYGIAIAAAVLLPADATIPKIVVAILLFVIYAWYVKAHFEADPDVDAEDLAPLRFHPLDAGRTVAEDGSPRLRVVNVQVLAALGLIIVGAIAFVDAVEHVASTLGVSQVLLALVIAPIATELPEKFNSIIWVRQGKDTLAMGNITGAMVFQSAIPVSVALLFAPESWVAGPGSYLAFTSAGIAFLSSAAIFLPMWRTGRLRGRWLLVGGVFYLAYLVTVGVGITVG